MSIRRTVRTWPLRSSESTPEASPGWWELLWTSPEPDGIPSSGRETLLKARRGRVAPLMARRGMVAALESLCGKR